MSYVKNNLLTGEQIQFETKLNVLKLFATTATLCVLAVWTTFAASITTFSFFFFIGAIFTGVKSFIQLKSSEYAVTNKRIILKDGFLKRRSIEVMLNKVEGIGLEQSITDRILGCGTLVFMGTGGTKEYFRSVDSAMDFRKAVQEAISKYENRKSA